MTPALTATIAVLALVGTIALMLGAMFAWDRFSDHHRLGGERVLVPIVFGLGALWVIVYADESTPDEPLCCVCEVTP